ncbi:MAG: hypothetical protein JRJ85_13535 [Deltaproteobacteria bacterium]|nr:hypothetical protein [Deltaproteobacteria bacterium]
MGYGLKVDRREADTGATNEPPLKFLKEEVGERVKLGGAAEPDLHNSNIGKK